MVKMWLGSKKQEFDINWLADNMKRTEWNFVDPDALNAVLNGKSYLQINIDESAGVVAVHSNMVGLMVYDLNDAKRPNSQTTLEHPTIDQANRGHFVAEYANRYGLTSLLDENGNPNNRFFIIFENFIEQRYEAYDVAFQIH